VIHSSLHAPRAEARPDDLIMDDTSIVQQHDAGFAFRPKVLRVGRVLGRASARGACWLLLCRCCFVALLCATIVLLCTSASATATDNIPSDQLEFFESKVRPLLVEHCYQCHSAEAEDVEAGLLLDSKAGWSAGGDSGPAIVPGRPDESLLIEAVRYEEEVVAAMPPKSKLADEDIQILEQWIEMGAPDPRTESTDAQHANDFDLDSRVESHWSWRPIASPDSPIVENTAWSEAPIDRFVLAKLEAAGLRPAPPAERRTWLRRVYLDLIGLPPTLKQIDSFLTDASAGAHERVVSELLDSHHFGEKWARHWLDLVRYSETYGHEFDYPIRAAHEYRDYVIRALNADVPYDQFVREHIAGDLIDPPRRHSREEFNESIIGTGFWYLHDATHAPTDVLGNEADIIDNQIDVFGKAFLGLTVACARCHDHKFDAISTADYYALSAYLQSSCRQYAPLDPGGKIAALTDQIAVHRQRADELLTEFAASNSRTEPIEPAADEPSLWQDFGGNRLPSGWTTSGTAFRHVTDQRLGAGGNLLRSGTVSSRVLSRQQQGILRSPTFEIPARQIHVLARATAGVRMNVIIDNYQMTPFSALLFKGTLIDGKQTKTGGKWKWLSFGGDLRKYVGHRAYLEFIDDGDGYIEIDQIRFSDDGPPPIPDSVAEDKLLVELPDAAAQEIEAAKRLAKQLPTPRYVLSIAQGTPENAHIYVRGSHTNLGDVVPPRFLSALGGERLSRLELADRVASPDNPLTARVIVNRLWHHLFGRGIVPTVDDFGPQGQPPSHPELLDWLATDFIQHGWSLKHTIGQIVLTQTYRQSSEAHPDLTVEQIDAADPTNQLLHRMPIRRLPAETIRDSILAISGQLVRNPFGKSVPTHLTSFMTGRGRPKQSGPLDGDGRRSIYLAVTRNFLNPFLLTFDMPTPFGPQGRRSQSNVPAQALALMNDPFVIEQAAKWAERVRGESNVAVSLRETQPDQQPVQQHQGTAERPALSNGSARSAATETSRSLVGQQHAERAGYIALMVEQAHGVPPTAKQLDALQQFLDKQRQLYGADDHRAWADLAHALLNMKAFYFVR